jgi:hypothetical protein
MRGDPALLGDAGERAVPARLEFAGHQPVGGIDCTLLTEGAVGGVARCLQITAKSLAYLIPPLPNFVLSGRRGGDGAGANHAEERFLDCVINAQATEGDAARLSMVHPAAVAAVARDVVLHSAVAERLLASAAPAADQAARCRQSKAAHGTVLHRSKSVTLDFENHDDRAIKDGTPPAFPCGIPAGKVGKYGFH